MRVLDLSDEKGWLCGRVLADLGAYVIKVEPPGGDMGRALGPFYHDETHPEKSLPWWAYNTSKKGITLDLKSGEGRELFRALVKVSDILIESFAPGYMDSLGLGYSALTRVNSGLVFTSITPFGQTGPRRNYRASDLTLMALGGIMFITGEPHKVPLRLCLDQSYLLGGAFAAFGTLLAYHHRQACGLGQHVDVSILECLTRLNYRDPVRWEFEGDFSRRMGNRIARGKVSQRLIWRCQDGYVSWAFREGEAGAKGTYALVQWIVKEATPGHAELEKIRWEEVDLVRLSQEDVNRWEKVVAAFFLKHSRKELQRESLKWDLGIVEISDLKGVRRSKQLKSRNFWVNVEHPELGETITYPGGFFLSSETENYPRNRAPLIGQHNQEVYGELLELNAQEIQALSDRGII